MLAPLAELQQFTGCTRASAIIRRLAALGAPAYKNAQGVPAVPNDWWQAFKAGHAPKPAPTTAANDEPGHTLRLDRLPQGRRRHGPHA